MSALRDYNTDGPDAFANAKPHWIQRVMESAIARANWDVAVFMVCVFVAGLLAAMVLA